MIKKLLPPAHLMRSLPGGSGATGNLGVRDRAICQVSYAVYGGLRDTSSQGIPYVVLLVLSDISTMTYYLDFVIPSPHLSSTGGNHAPKEPIRDTIVPRGAAGARAAESSVYVIVSRRGACQDRTARRRRPGEQGYWRAVGHAAAGREQMAPPILPGSPRRVGGTAPWRSPLQFFPLGSSRS